MKINRSLIWVCCLVFLITGVFAELRFTQEVELLEVITPKTIEGKTIDAVYWVEVNLLKPGDLMRVYVAHNDKNYTLHCEAVYDPNDDLVAEKTVCTFPDEGSGAYNFRSVIVRGEKEVVAFYDKFVYNRDGEVQMSFVDIVNVGTRVVIDVEAEFFPVIVESRIPKEVIEYLDDNNKDVLIDTTHPFEIIENDPLIAWHVEEPTQINYTIKKKVSKRLQEEFETGVAYDNQTTWYAYVFLYILIIIVVILILRPIFKRKKKNTQENAE